MYVVLTGDRNVGKTTVVKRVVERLGDRALDPVGFYTDGGPETLELVDVQTGERTVFASQSAEFGDGPTVGRYAVNPAAIERGLSLARTSGDVLVVDEIGTLDRRGEGFAPILSALQTGIHHSAVLSVRRGVDQYVADALPSDAPITRLEVTEANRDVLPARIVATLVDDASSDEGALE
ncbi:MAG: nucleoside-triphosphatase [Halobacteriota archaeon]